jgi:hypothetical protein
MLFRHSYECSDENEVTFLSLIAHGSCLLKTVLEIVSSSAASNFSTVITARRLGRKSYC